MKNEKTYRHPAYGQISLSRINGRAMFYGSDLVQEQYIELRIHQSELSRSLTDDHHHSIRRLVTVRLTNAQFAEMITSMNVGEGVPCTIEQLPEGHVEKLEEFVTRKEVVHNDFKERMDEFSNRIKKYGEDLKSITSKQNVGKQDKLDIMSAYNQLQTEIQSNIPFFLKCFQEGMDKVVTEAKMEVDAAILHKVTSLGMSELFKQNQLLSNVSTQSSIEDKS